MKNREEEIERQEVENRADRSESEHEIPDEFYIPMFGFSDIFLIYMIRRQGYLRQIIEEIIEQDLAWQHREKR